ncbi:MAG: hypothetical protein Ct9H90mP16_02420 [Candidatus Poseidoniales archaeon]|nr:MAG: hypothetical protein Ct9H90mP16_02420 [Candidatus Poseidoniales archaeon]
MQVMTAPDGRVYAYQAGWNDVHITDVTDPYNTTVVGITSTPTHKSWMSNIWSTMEMNS